MKLTPEQQAVLDGSKGEVMAKVMKSLVMYGETFGADKMVPVTSEYGHTVISFGIGVMKPVYDLYDQLIEAGALSEAEVLRRPAAAGQERAQLELPAGPDLQASSCTRSRAAMRSSSKSSASCHADAYTCACYLDEVGNKPETGRGALLGRVSARWSTPTACSARGATATPACSSSWARIAGCVPYFGLLTDDGPQGRLDSRGATRAKKPEAAAARLRHRHEGHGAGAVCQGPGQVARHGAHRRRLRLSQGLRRGHRLQRRGGPLPHRATSPPRPCSRARRLIREDAPVYVIDDAELRAREGELSRACGKTCDAKPKLCFMGCPHLTLAPAQELDGAHRARRLRANGQQKGLQSPPCITAAPGDR